MSPDFLCIIAASACQTRKYITTFKYAIRQKHHNMKKKISGISDADRILMDRLLPLECNYKPRQETLDMLYAYGNTVLLQKGDALIDAGEFDSNLYILVDGMLRCWFWNGDKEETDLVSLIPTVFFNYHSYCGNQGSFYCIEACTDSRAIRISRADFEKLISESHDLTRWFLALSQAQLYYMERKSRLSVGDSRERYLTMLRENPDILSNMSLQDVASYLKITPQYLSKLRRRIHLTDK